MRKILACLLIICALNCVAIAPVCGDSADYSPGLGMTINEFANKYNIIPAAAGAPYKRLPTNASLMNRASYTCAVFNPVSNTGLEMLAITREKNAKTADAGLDAVFLFCYNDKDWMPFVATAKRIAYSFSPQVFGINYSDLYVGKLITEYYETMAKENDMYYYIQLGSDSEYCIALFSSDGIYAFVLAKISDIVNILNG